jgi:hypothetical protein
MPAAGEVTAVSVDVVEAAALDGLASDQQWRIGSVLGLPSRQVAHAAYDRRWQIRFVKAVTPSAIVGLLPVFRFTGQRFPTPIFDPAAVAPGLFADRPADEYLLIGGSTELYSAVAFAGGLHPSARCTVGRVLVDAAYRLAFDEGLTGAALYLRDEQRELFSHPCRPRPWHRLDDFARLAVPAGRREEDYLANLAGSHRSIVRRDWRRRREQRLHSVAEPAREVVDESLPLVADVKRRHDVEDHPRLIKLRLDRWATEPFGTRLAFTVRDVGGRLLAVSFGCHWDKTLELHEIGLTPDAGMRQLAYVEALVYAPLRYAQARCCAELHLGLGSPRPKTLRGARLSPVWAISAGGQHNA